MDIEFQCSQCSRLLRVPAEAAGKNARCPQCQSLMIVPAAGAAAPRLPDAVVAPPPPGKPDHPFGDSTGGANPFALDSNLNPYASPASPYAPPAGPGVQLHPINPRPVGLDPILQYALEIWKANLGLLVGTTVVFFVIIYGLAAIFGMAQSVLEQNGKKEVGAAVAVIGNVVSNLIQLFLGIGQAQIGLKLARRQAASFGDLFGGIAEFLPVLGAAILAGLALVVGFVMLIVPGILMMLAFWPYYYLIVDRKAGVIDSFSVASQITKGNWGTAFLVWLVSMGAAILGCATLCVGFLFAIPFITIMWSVAYLMMSGQLLPQPAQVNYSV